MIGTIGLPPVSSSPSVTGDVREYFFHVGLMADLSVAVTAEAADSADGALGPGDDVTITVKASNAGPGHRHRHRGEGEPAGGTDLLVPQHSHGNLRLRRRRLDHRRPGGDR